jgi:hypothetical protein
VINPPHATILAVGAGEKRVVVKDGAACGSDGDVRQRSRPTTARWTGRSGRSWSRRSRRWWRRRWGCSSRSRNPLLGSKILDVPRNLF